MTDTILKLTNIQFNGFQSAILSGVYSAIPYTTLFAVPLCGRLADFLRARYLSTVVVRKAFTFIGQTQGFVCCWFVFHFSSRNITTKPIVSQAMFLPRTCTDQLLILISDLCTINSWLFEKGCVCFRLRLQLSLTSQTFSIPLPVLTLAQLC